MPEPARRPEPSPEPAEPLAYDAAGVARALSISKRTVWVLASTGRLPVDFRICTRPRWTAESVRAFIDRQRAARGAA